MHTVKIEPSSEESELAYYTSILPEIFTGLESYKKGSSKVLEGNVSEEIQLSAFAKTLRANGVSLMKNTSHNTYHLQFSHENERKRFMATFHRILNNLSHQALQHP